MAIFITIAITFIVCDAAFLVVNYFLSFIKDPLIVVIVAAALLLLSIIFIILALVARKKDEKQLQKEIEAIHRGLVNFGNGVKPNVILQTNNPYIKHMVDVENNLTFGPRTLDPHFIYPEKEFLPYAKLVLEEEEPSSLAFFSFYEADEKVRDDINIEVSKVFEFKKNIFRGECLNGFDYIVRDFESKDDIIARVKSLSNKFPRASFRLGFFPETSFDSFASEVEESYKSSEPFLVLEGRSTHELAFRDMINFYLSRDLGDQNLLSQFMKDILPYLPFSHIALSKGNRFIRQVNWNNTKKYSEYDPAEFGLTIKEEIVISAESRYVLTLASLANFGSIYKETKHRILTIKGTLAAILAPLSKIDEENLMADRYENALNGMNAYSYSINSNYDIIHTSKAFQNKFAESLINKKCYEAIYKKKAPCASCPLKNELRKVLVPQVGTTELDNIAYSNMDTFDVYLINKGANVVSKKAKLQERLLDLINNDYRGYLLCFKIDNLEDIARKGKVKENEVVASLLKVLSSYGLNGNLYQKETDEFVYILENAGSNEATEVAKRLALALDEKLSFDEKGYLPAPKVILLSYPLEVSTLFDLDSLSRTLYKEVDKKGRLYRIATEPYPIDKRRYYIEIIENSFKKDAIPVSIKEIRDRQEEFNFKEIHFAYLDDNENPINEDDITLYAKQENIYGTLIERLMKELEFDETSTYVLPLHKEGQNNQLLLQITNALNKKHIDHDRLIFMVQEKDIYMHLDFYHEARKNGYRFSYWTIENRPQGDERLDIEFVYAYTPKLKASKLYQLRVTRMLNEGYTFRIDDNALDYLKEARFLG